MSKKGPYLELLTEALQEHAAFKAWRQIQPMTAEPRSIEVLKRKRSGAAFRLNGVMPDGASIVAKRTLRTTGEVERLVYEHVLPLVGLPILRCHGFVADAEGEWCWLFIEDAGRTPYTVGQPGHRTLAARWLAATHVAAVPATFQEHLPDRGPAYYLRLLHGCRARLLEHLAGTPLCEEQIAVLHRILGFCDGFEAQWSAIENMCDAMPRTLVHGDFVVKNLRVRNDAAGDALLVFDWQFAGWGVPATDLTQFAGLVASPDLEAYLFFMRDASVRLAAQEVRGAAACGGVFRIIDALEWATTGSITGNTESLINGIGEMKSYAERIPTALTAVERSCA